MPPNDAIEFYFELLTSRIGELLQYREAIAKVGIWRTHFSKESDTGDPTAA